MCKIRKRMNIICIASLSDELINLLIYFQQVAPKRAKPRLHFQQWCPLNGAILVLVENRTAIRITRERPRIYP